MSGNMAINCFRKQTQSLEEKAQTHSQSDIRLVINSLKGVNANKQKKCYGKNPKRR